jgi:hypothetical protein
VVDAETSHAGSMRRLYGGHLSKQRITKWWELLLTVGESQQLNIEIEFLPTGEAIIHRSGS